MKMYLIEYFLLINCYLALVEWRHIFHFFYELFLLEKCHIDVQRIVHHNVSPRELFYLVDWTSPTMSGLFFYCCYG